MSIVLFSSITTDEALQGMEAEGQNYTGLYVDMNDKEQRKFVKDSALLISDIIKKVDRSRIDQKKAHGILVEAEAKEITARLQAANLPFSMLIDAYKHERAQILAEQKAKDDAMALGLQIEADHDHALLMDKVFDLGAKEREQERIDNEANIASEAARKAVQQEQARTAAEAKAEELARLQREADTANVSAVRSAAKVALMSYAGLSEDQARAVVMAIHKCQIPSVTISY